MKKCLRILLLLALFTAVLCLGAYAASEAPTVPGIYEVSVLPGYTSTVAFEAELADGTPVAAETKLLDEADKDFYANAEKIKVTYNGAGSGFQLILALTDDLDNPGAAPTESNIKYIDQDTMTGSEISFTVYPSSLENGKQYYVYLANSDGLNKILTFKYFLPYKLGDVDGENGLNSYDASLILQNLVGTYDFVGTGALAADVDGENGINSYDASLILQHLVGSYTIPGWED
ncbi:MAG: dockerin type I repeat-containing protein [Oscillospiraceae bacterium]|jgi:hypothetical protein|nr:dockerin type I repeat-containing protein [Oscillospiraceae bacterium]